MKNLDAVFQLLKVDKKLGTIVLAAIALISVATIFVTAFQDQAKDISPFIIILYMLGIVFVLYIISHIVNDGKKKAVLSWFLVVFMVAYISVIFASVVFPALGLPKSRCIIQFWDSSDDCAPPIDKPERTEWKDLPDGARITTLGGNAVYLRAAPDMASRQVSQLTPNVLYPDPDDTNFSLRSGRVNGKEWYEVVNNTTGETLYVSGANASCFDENNNEC